MNNDAELQRRFANLAAKVLAFTGADFAKQGGFVAVLCNGCGVYYAYPAPDANAPAHPMVSPAPTDFALWKLGPEGADKDYCPACWS